jgi:hypothetical protein
VTLFDDDGETLEQFDVVLMDMREWVAYSVWKERQSETPDPESDDPFSLN